MRVAALLPLLASILLPGVGRAAEPRSLAVAVAANLKPAFEEIAARFQATHPGVEVRATYGASGIFFAQIANGAPFDLFLSADAEFPARVFAQGLADGKAFTYAIGKLVVWVPKDSRVDLQGKGLQALAEPSIERIAIANPEVAPYGRAARTALERAGLLPALQPRIVTGQSVAQAAQFAESGSAQAAFLPLSLTLVPPLSAAGRTWAVPATAHEPIEQAGVVLRGARQPALARELAAFLVGESAREVLARHGYDLPLRPSPVPPAR
ncbi:MAG: molybdate ABC transporter substrate-binding protein [Deltaproteobacteria bacterium]